MIFPSGRFIAAAITALLAAVACGTKGAKLVAPDTLEAYCAPHRARAAAVVSILSSVADRIQPIDVPSDAVLLKALKDDGGVIGRWKTQPLYMPGTARALGVGSDYIDVREVTIPNGTRGSDSRIIYIRVQTPNGPKRLALQAYDTENPCASSSGA